MKKEFDEKNCALIGGFLKLKDDCNFFEKNFLGDGFYNTNRNRFDFIYYASFWSSFRDVCDLPIFFLINEEISNGHGRDLFPALMAQVFESDGFAPGEADEETSLRFARHHEDLENLLVRQYNEILASSLLDFTVSAFSVFEFWIDRLYAHVCLDYEKRTLEGRIKKISKELQKYAESPTEDALKTIAQRILLKASGFISFPDKINAIRKIIDESKYPRDIKKDLEIVGFIGKQRNTVHNLGIYRGADIRIVVGETEHFLATGRPQRSESWTDTLKLIGQLVKIYTAFLSSLRDRESFLSGFVDAQVDLSKIEILTLTMNDFLAQNLAGHDIARTRRQYSLFLRNKLNFTASQTDVFINNLLDSERKEFSEIDTYSLLAIPNPRATLIKSVLP